MNKRPSLRYSACALLLALAFLVAGCRPAGPAVQTPVETMAAETPEQETAIPVQPTTGDEPVDMEMPVFAVYQEPVVEEAATLQQEPIAADLSNVQNIFVLSAEQIKRLGQDGFVVTPGAEKEFFTVYEKARYANVPIFVTSDSLLHSYHLLFDKVLRTAERERFIPLLRDLNAALLAQAEAQYRSLQGGPWEANARQVLAFLAVGSKLLDPAVAVPEDVAGLVDQELALIEAADGIRPSPIFPALEFGEDYSQYIPRGHYTLSDDLKAYFKSMMWYGRMTFLLETRDPEVGRNETRSALLLAQALRDAVVNDRPAADAWADLYSPTVFFVGRSDDLTVMQYLEVMDRVYGPVGDVKELVDEAKLDQFLAEAKLLPPPRILGIVISVDDEEEQATKGMRLMGQRFVPDAYIFRQLIYRNVGTASNRRGLPKGLDVPAAMGSERAYALLEAMGETAYENYPQQMQKARTWLSGLSEAEWTETLYNTWLYTFQPLLEVPGEGYPQFMQSQAWLDKQLNSTLGSWAELKHDTILYAKQVYAEAGGGPPAPEPVLAKNYVEPVPGFYARLSALTAMTVKGLAGRGLLNDLDRDNLRRLQELANAFQVMAEKELRGEALTENEESTIRFYGRDLEHLVMAAADSDAQDAFGQQFMEEEPQAAVVADVATDPDPRGDGSLEAQVLEVGVGRINEIHVVVPVVQEDGSIGLQVAKGGTFSYYEFSWPAQDRLTDEKWHEMLDTGEAPDRPEWTASFFTGQGESSDLLDAIRQYQSQATGLYWEASMYMMPENRPQFEGTQPYDTLEEELHSLVEAGQYVGHQLISTRVTAVDFQSESQAIITVEEVWNDSLYEGEYPNDGNEIVGKRGPYPLTVNYSLERQEEGWPAWKVTGVAFANQPPEWSQ